MNGLVPYCCCVGNLLSGRQALLHGATAGSSRVAATLAGRLKDTCSHLREAVPQCHTVAILYRPLPPSRIHAPRLIRTMYLSTTSQRPRLHLGRQTPPETSNSPFCVVRGSHAIATTGLVAGCPIYAASRSRGSNRIRERIRYTVSDFNQQVRPGSLMCSRRALARCRARDQ